MSEPKSRSPLAAGEEGLLQSWEVAPGEANTVTDTLLDQILGGEMDADEVPDQNEVDEVSDEEEADPTEEAVEDADEEADDEDEEVSDEEEADEFEEDADEEESEGHREPVPEDAIAFVDDDGNPITAKEAKLGWLRQADYTRKNQALAAEKKETIQAREQARGEIQKVAEALQDVETVFTELAGNPPDHSLREKDPGEYAAQVADWQNRQQMLEAIRARRHQETQKLQSLQQANLQEVARIEHERLLEALPEWRDQAALDEGLQTLAGHFQTEYGYTPEELGQVQDHRAILIMKKAMAYDRLQKEGQKTIQNPAGELPKKGRRPKPKGTKRSRQKDGRFAKDRGKALQEHSSRLSETGSVYDAARAIETLLGDDI